ncbi:MAG: type II toxin-antitoxin system VapC family toxin [Chloroflexi bacterium]|nr:type II toxin-antitoxin system VapC family toxin [Chloroflexota bacterium]
MSEVRLFIPDASTMLRAIFPLRDYSLQANDLIADFNGGRINLLAPYHFPLEVASGIRNAVVNRQLQHEQGRVLFRQFLANRIPTVDEVGLTDTAFDNCQRYSISIRDSLYVTLAQFYEAPLITADENLLRAITRFPHALLLGDYESPR